MLQTSTKNDLKKKKITPFPPPLEVVSGSQSAPTPSTFHSQNFWLKRALHVSTPEIRGIQQEKKKNILQLNKSTCTVVLSSF